MAVEVFKTNVSKRKYAKVLLIEIHKAFIDYSANFDLEDCDKILRVQCNRGKIKSRALILFLKSFGYHAEVLVE